MPKTSMLTKLYYADSKTTGTRSQVIYVQEIPALKEAAEGITYDALEFTSAKIEKGPKGASVVTIPVLYDETQHAALQALAAANTEKHWFVRYPDTTDVTTNKPLVRHFTASIDLEGDAIAIRGMIQDTLTLYINSDISETLDFPSA